MKTTLSQIKKAYYSKKQYANATSNSGVVELTKAVRIISVENYDTLNRLPEESKFLFIASVLKSRGWNGYGFDK